ncbi:MAG TPA: hypothetical protein VNM90_24350, partial [Haliangium sp.]|nr:hypothetical protein [Haliangium sp.]
MAEPRGAERGAERATAWIRWLERQASRFIPAAILQQGGERLRRTRLVARVYLLLAIVSLVLNAVMLVRQDYWFLAANLTLLGLMLGGLMLLRRGVRAEIVGMLLVGASYVANVLGTVHFGGIQAPPAQVLLIVPLLAQLMAGRRAGVSMFALVSVTFVFLGVYGPGDSLLDRVAPLLVVNTVIVLV